MYHCTGRLHSWNFSRLLYVGLEFVRFYLIEVKEQTTDGEAALSEFIISDRVALAAQQIIVYQGEREKLLTLLFIQSKLNLVYWQ